MENNASTYESSNLEKHFANVFQRLLIGENLNLYEENVSFMFEIISKHLLADAPGRKYCWYDGVSELSASIRKLKQVEFTGEMWVRNIGNTTKQWKEDFRATVTDKNVTKQGIWIMIWVGSSQAEGRLETAFGLTE